jgi:hypothetical protein
MTWEICTEQSLQMSYYVNGGSVNMLNPTHLATLGTAHNFQHDKKKTPGSRISQKYLASLMRYDSKTNRSLVSDRLCVQKAIK